MDPASPVGSARPQPGLTQAIGVLNLVFGSFLFLLGLGCMNQLGPSLAESRRFRLEPGDAQNVYDQMHKEMLAKLEAREAAATDDAEKARLRRERRALAAQYEPDVERKLDLRAINRDLLWMSWYVWADVVTGPILNLLMLASGIGLTQLRVWARRLALWVAALKITRLIVLTLLLLVVVIPHTSRATASIASTGLGKLIIARFNAGQPAGPANADPATGPFTPENFAPRMGLGEQIFAVLMLVFGVIYPAFSLAVLSRPGSRAACILADQAEAEERTDPGW